MTVPVLDSSGPAHAADRSGEREILLIALCTDIGSGLGQAIRNGAIEATRDALAVCSAQVCTDPGRLVAVIKSLGPKRVVVACCHLDLARESILARLRSAGIGRAGVRLVDLRPVAKADPRRVLGQSTARVLAAIAGAAHADLGAPERYRLVPGPMSRRNLLRPGNFERRPVASWIRGRCDGRACCTECVVACPRGALRCTADGVVVDENLCSGCGACLPACPDGAMTLSGWSIAQLAAEAGSLVAQAQRAARYLAKGVSVTCEHGPSAGRVGGDWLALEVPSLRMVTIGWLLQPLGAGTSVAIAGCGDEECSVRARELADLCDGLAGESASRMKRLADSSFMAWAPRDGAGMGRKPFGQFVLREPDATVTALRELIPLERWGAEPVRCALDSVQADSSDSNGGRTRAGRKCVACGQPLAAGIGEVVSRRLATSHPLLAARMVATDRCSDCLLLARVN